MYEYVYISLYIYIYIYIQVDRSPGRPLLGRLYMHISIHGYTYVHVYLLMREVRRGAAGGRPQLN